MPFSMGRTVIVGDVHGCADELEDLLSYIGLTSADRLFFVGDLVVRGPQPHRTLRMVRSHRGKAVRGNHEDRLLRFRESEDTRTPLRIGTLTRRTVNELTGRDWKFIGGFPLHIDLSAHNIRIVHAGIVPDLPFANQDPRVLMNIRTLGMRGEPREERGPRSWAHDYEGPEHIVFGHNAQIEPEIAEHATGIDTGAVYGGRLTAMVLREGEKPPRLQDRKSVLVSVPARKAYIKRT
jgi:diadenosine tetraphosphatase ApaH/serine/threonine PP2A family protein phosphatase